MARWMRESSISYSTEVARAATEGKLSIVSKTLSERIRIANTSISRAVKAETSPVAAREATSTSPTRDPGRWLGPRDTVAGDEQECFPLINLLIIKCYN